jgi:hypothetical protein
MDSYMLGNVIADQILYTRNWPFASAISMVLTAVTTAGVLIMMGMQRRETARITDTTKVSAIETADTSAMGDIKTSPISKIEGSRAASGNGGAL